MTHQRNTNRHQDNAYPFEESEAEIARLIQQGELFTNFEGGILPEQEDLNSMRNVLDVACGPGQWAIDAAEQYPDLAVTGIDSSKQMTEYASSHTNNLENVQFLEMDITQPLDFADQAFDVVNARFLQGVLTTEEWPLFLRECVRILRPGGIIRLTDMCFSESNSREFNHLLSLLPLALSRTGRSFSPDGLTYGLMPVFSTLLRTAGCHMFRFRPFTVEFSCGMEAYESMVQYLRATYAPEMLGAYFVKTGVISMLDYEDLYHRAMNDLGSSHFCGASYLITATGEKPKSTVIVVYHDRFVAHT